MAGAARVAIFAVVSTLLLRAPIFPAERSVADDFRRARKEIGSCKKSVHCCALRHPGSGAGWLPSLRSRPPAWLTPGP